MLFTCTRSQRRVCCEVGIGTIGTGGDGGEDLREDEDEFREDDDGLRQEEMGGSVKVWDGCFAQIRGRAPFRKASSAMQYSGEDFRNSSLRAGVSAGEAVWER